jgi:hypothetical protein
MAGDRHPPPECQDEEQEPQTEDDENPPVINLLLPESNVEEDWAADISVSDLYDVLDSTGVWCEAKVRLYRLLRTNTINN